MARIPYVDPDRAPPQVREALEAAPPLNIFRTLAHAETALRPALRLGAAILGSSEVDPKLRELAILHVAALSDAEYEWVQHAEIARAVGASDEQVAALQGGEVDAGCFDDTEQLVLRFTTEVVRDVGASQATFDEMAAVFSTREIVELLLTIGYYMMLARVMRSVDIDIDDAVGMGVVRSAERR